MVIDRRVREYAHIVQARILFANLFEGDMPALDLKYHLGCLTSLYNRARKYRAAVTFEELDIDFRKIVVLHWGLEQSVI